MGAIGVQSAGPRSGQPPSNVSLHEQKMQYAQIHRSTAVRGIQNFAEACRGASPFVCSAPHLKTEIGSTQWVCCTVREKREGAAPCRVRKSELDLNFTK
jgi:hypothetical protein